MPVYPVYVQRCVFSAVLAHGWLTGTDVGVVKVLLFARHMLEVENRPICVHRRVSTDMQHLMHHWSLRMCVYIIGSA